MRFHSASRRAGRKCPNTRYLDALCADLEAALPLVWGRRGASACSSGAARPACFHPTAIERLLGRHPRAAAAGARLRDYPGSQSRHLRARALSRFSRRWRDAAVDRSAELRRQIAAALSAVFTTRRRRALRWKRRAASFDTFNIDLMYALPDQSLAMLDADLDAALVLRAAAPVGLSPDAGAEHLVRHVPAAAARRRPGQRHAGPHRAAHGQSRAAALRGVGLRACVAMAAATT